MLSKITIEKPNTEVGLWKILMNGTVICLCPSEEIAIKLVQVIVFYDKHMLDNIMEGLV
jgi:hypothetical protein